MATTQEANLSYYLSPEEIETLGVSLREQRCKARSSAIVQVFGTDPPHHSNWTQRCSGVAVFVADASRRSFYIQVYDPEVGEKLFEQELYKEFHYVSESPFFHQFEGDYEVIGLNFAFQEEASAFAEAVLALIAKRKSKTAERHQLYNNDQENVAPTHERTVANTQPSFEMRVTTSHSDKNIKRAKKIRKSEIGNPENFVHVYHVGYDSEASSPAKNQEAILATILQLSNIKPRELEDENAKEVFLTYIESNGGLEKVYKKLTKAASRGFSFRKKTTPSIRRPKAPLPELLEESQDSAEKPSTTDFSLAPSDSSSGGFSRWNKLANNEASASSGTPSHHKRELPPIPLQPQACEMSRSQSLPHGKSGAAPPPPPPPPTANAPKMVPESPNRPPMQRSPSLPQGKPANIKHLHKESNEDTIGRDDLLNQIRNPGFRLKKVEAVVNEKTHSSGFENSLIASLAQTLEGRSRACRGSSSSGEDSEPEEGSNEDSDEWD